MGKHDSLVKHLTVLEFNEGNMLYDELLSEGVDIARAIGAVYRRARQDERREQKERRRAYMERRRQERADLSLAATILGMTLEGEPENE